MKRYYFLLFQFLFLLLNLQAQKLYTTYLWHMDQPVYWADKSKDKPDSKQFVEESHRLKMSGENIYAGSSVPHPTNNLEEIFSKADRVAAYQYSPKNALSSILDVPNAGAQLSISAGLMENIQSLGLKNQWGYSSSWMNAYKDAIGWKTSGGFPRLDVVNFTYDHTLSPLVSERTLIKQIQAHQYALKKYYGTTSKGYWPAEAAFSERIIKALVECGIQWSVVPNSHLARTLSDYVHPYNINGNIEAPNRADKVDTKGNNWFDGVIDGRGSRLAVPYSYQAHKAQYIDPGTGQSYKIDVVPMCNYLGYIDGYSGANASELSAKIEPYSDVAQPSIVLLAHDGDNAWGGGSSYYNEAVTSFTHGAANAGFKPTTIQQFLLEHPVPENDIVRVEDGAWVNAENDWGHPQFINWLWPLYNKATYRFDPNGWTEDARNWAVITATENFVKMAEDLEGGNLRTNFIADGGTSATNAEKAWHFYFGGLNSGFMYYGKSEDMEVKPSLTGNIAIEYAQKVIDSKVGMDNTAPSVFIPQRFPYNPGEVGFSPYTGYKKVNYSSDFHIWTFVYDVSGLASVTLKYRLDKDGYNPVNENDNDTYAGGAGVEAWQSVSMTRQPMAADPADPELNFFIQPRAKADLCFAEIVGLKDKLVDYYVEAVDTKGNIFKTPIQHVYVGTGDGQTTTDGNVTWEPKSPTTNETIVITCKNATASSKLHWGVNGADGNWKKPIAAYQPANSVEINTVAVETPFTLVNGVWQVVLGPFNNASQPVTSVNFVINHGNNNWDNNGGSNYNITVSPIITDNPTGINITQKIDPNTAYTFINADFGFSSPKGNTFKGIKITSLPSVGMLTFNGANVTIDQIVNDVSKLVYTAASTTASFSYKIIDSADLISDGTYNATFTVNTGKDPITVSFKKPAEWGTSDVYVYAWTSTANDILGKWPGLKMTTIGTQGWYSYTFDSQITSVNVVFNKNTSPQTVNIINITESSCFEQDGMDGNNVKVKKVSCPGTGLFSLEIIQQISIYPQPAKDKFNIRLPNDGINYQSTLMIMDLNGKSIQTEMFDGESGTIDCSKLQKGVYLVKVITKDKSKVYSGKLVKI